MCKGNQHPLRTPGDFNPRMISAPRPGFTSTFGTFGMQPRTPFRPYTPIPSNSPEYGQYSPEYTLAPGQDPADTIPQALLPEYMSPRPRAPEYMSPRPRAPDYMSPRPRAPEYTYVSPEPRAPEYISPQSYTPEYIPPLARAPIVTPRTVTFTRPSPGIDSTPLKFGDQSNQSDETRRLRTHVPESRDNGGLLSIRQLGTQTSPPPLYVNTWTSTSNPSHVRYQHNSTNTGLSFGNVPPPASDWYFPSSIPDPIPHQNFEHQGASPPYKPSVNSTNQEARPPNATSIIQCEHSCRPKAVEAPTYSGKDKWDTFISLFQKVAEINKWDNTARCERLLVSLRGSALEFVDTFQLRVTKDYDLLKQALAQRFGVTSNEALYRVKFKGRRRNNNEDLDKYIQDLQYLAERAYPNERSNIYHRLIVDQFIEGISNRDCKQYLQLNLNLCKESDSSLVQEVLKYAHNYESVVGSTDRIRKPYDDHTANAIKQQSNDSRPRDPPQHNPKKGKSKSEGQGEGRREPSRIICYKCQEEGHIASRCPKNQQNKQENE